MLCQPKKLNIRLKILRTEKGYSRKDIAVFLGYRTTHLIDAWENGHKKPSYDHLSHLGIILDTTPENILPVFTEQEKKDERRRWEDYMERRDTARWEKISQMPGWKDTHRNRWYAKTSLHTHKEPAITQSPSSFNDEASLEIKSEFPAQPLRILAVHPGIKRTGYAVLTDTNIYDWKIHKFGDRNQSKTLTAKSRKFIKDLIKEYTPDLFVIEETRFQGSQRTKRAHRLVDEMTRVARTHRVPVRSYTPALVKKTVAGSESATKKQIAELVVKRYPWLKEKHIADGMNVEKYWQHLFDAIALGITAYEEYRKTTVLKDSPQTSNT